MQQHSFFLLRLVSSSRSTLPLKATEEAFGACSFLQLTKCVLEALHTSADLHTPYIYAYNPTYAFAHASVLLCMNQVVASSSADMTVKIWSLKDFSCLRVRPSAVVVAASAIVVTVAIVYCHRLSCSPRDGYFLFLLRSWQFSASNEKLHS